MTHEHVTAEPVQAPAVPVAAPSGSQATNSAKGGDSGGKPVGGVGRVFQDHLSNPATRQPIPGTPKTTQSGGRTRSPSAC